MSAFSDSAAATIASPGSPSQTRKVASAPEALARCTIDWALVVSESRESARLPAPADASDGRDEVPRTLMTSSRAWTWTARSIASSLAPSDAGEPSVASRMVSR